MIIILGVAEIYLSVARYIYPESAEIYILFARDVHLIAWRCTSPFSNK